MEKESENRKAWVVGVNMGYGHQRTAFPLKGFAYKGQVMNANDYPGIPADDRKVWEESRRFYEAISRFKRTPLVGSAAFFCYDNLFQKIIDFYPRKDLSSPTFLTARTYGLIKKGWGKDFVDRMAKNPMPLVTTFFITAFMAEEFDYPNDIYLIVCDADVSRQWVSQYPMNSRINYCVPNTRVRERLKLYGVPKKRIFLTGFPLPESNIYSQKGSAKNDMDIAKSDLGHRLANLDPAGAYRSKYCGLVNEKLCELPKKSRRPLTIMFSAGGAGAQGEIGLGIMRQMGLNIRSGKMKLILSVGTNAPLKTYYEALAKEMKMSDPEKVEVLYEKNIVDYFTRFNKTLRKADILWTKPSELSFYSALGVPIIVAPPIGSQEDFNKSWLLKSGFGIEQEDLHCIGEWLGDWLVQGYLAEAAMEGFVEGE
ncbi:MAG: hypothetical protein MUD10_04330, partial [Candidatus Pacebacteria bacterium]|nr:hypothetical protein [Candidatus Paceibacterota bacterium]